MSTAPLFAVDSIFDFPVGTVLVDDPGGNPPASGYPKSNACNWLDGHRWRATSSGLAGWKYNFGAATYCNYFAVAGHNLGTGDSIALQVWNGSTFVSVKTFTNPNLPVLFDTFTLSSGTQWRIQASKSSAPVEIGVIAAGQYIEIDVPVSIPFTPPPLAVNPGVMNNVSEAGTMLGRTVGPKIFRTQMRFDLMSEYDWHNLTKYGKYAQVLYKLWRQPFFLAWCHDSNFDWEAAYAWASARMRGPSYSHSQFLQQALDIEGVCEEANASFN